MKKKGNFEGHYVTWEEREEKLREGNCQGDKILGGGRKQVKETRRKEVRITRERTRELKTRTKNGKREEISSDTNERHYKG